MVVLAQNLMQVLNMNMTDPRPETTSHMELDDFAERLRSVADMQFDQLNLALGEKTNESIRRSDDGFRVQYVSMMESAHGEGWEREIEWKISHNVGYFTLAQLHCDVYRRGIL